MLNARPRASVPADDQQNPDGKDETSSIVAIRAHEHAEMSVFLRAVARDATGSEEMLTSFREVIDSGALSGRVLN